MKSELGKHLFDFAVITDTHVNFGETECNSEFDINKGANARMRHVVQDLNRRELAFVIHLGDLVHPVPALPDLYYRAAEAFKTITADLRHPIHLVPGNHDIGDKPIAWGPAGVVSDAFIAMWRETFGPNFKAFDLGPCRFILLDAQVINTGLPAETDQQQWLEAQMADAGRKGLRTFLNTHYPPFLNEPGEVEHFDNIAQPGREWLLGLMARHGAEALFAGHVHNFWYNRASDTDFYALPSTAFVRQDYSEIYRATPPAATEGGRADMAKLGYFLIHVYENDHLFEVVRTYGETASPEQRPAVADAPVASVHPRLNANSRFGIDMRQSWLDVVEVPPSGSLDEFDRKRVRNDYPLMALVEMGVRRVRIPAMDLLDAQHRARLDAVARQGIQFTLFSFGTPSTALCKAIGGASALVDIWEIADTIDALPTTVAAVANEPALAGVRLFASKIRSKEDIEQGGDTYHHMIVHGFKPDDSDHIDRIAALERVDGLVFRVEGTIAPGRDGDAAAAACRAHGVAASLHVRMTTGKPGDVEVDEAWAAARAAESVDVAAANDDIYVYLDTFSDVDRGYFRRLGIVDRFYNPRPAFHAIRNRMAGII